jgi:hypothetical protein
MEGKKDVTMRASELLGLRFVMYGGLTWLGLQAAGTYDFLGFDMTICV